VKTLLRALMWTAGAILLCGLALTFWFRGLARDDGGAGRPAYGAYTFQQAESSADGKPADGKPATARDDGDPRTPVPVKPPRGGPVPRADGYVKGSLGNDFILPPMPPERPMDIHRRDSVVPNNALKTCFWPGPKLRPGFYTTDPDDYGIENQLPDTMNTFSTAWFRIPAGAKLVVKGEFPHMRHWSFTTYSEDGVPRDSIDDLDIDPDAGSFNPFRRGVPRDATRAASRSQSPAVNRRAHVRATPSTPAPSRACRSACTCATTCPTAAPTGWRRCGPAGRAPHGRRQGPDGRRGLRRDRSAAARQAGAADGAQDDLDGAQQPALAPVRPHAGARLRVRADGEVLQPRVPDPQDLLPAAGAGKSGGREGRFWSNLATRYGYKYISQAYGKVYVVHGKMPSTPRTWSGTRRR